jgi:hypothetical protein
MKKTTAKNTNDIGREPRTKPKNAKGRKDYNEKLAISNGGQRVALTISKLAVRN